MSGIYKCSRCASGHTVGRVHWDDRHGHAYDALLHRHRLGLSERATNDLYELALLAEPFGDIGKQYRVSLYGSRRETWVVYTLELLSWMFIPGQGFLNCLVYSRPKYLRWKQSYPNANAVFWL
jgi:hypothetical protein